jgi:hypothetical protein
MKKVQPARQTDSQTDMAKPIVAFCKYSSLTVEGWSTVNEKVRKE